MCAKVVQKHEIIPKVTKTLGIINIPATGGYG